MSYSGLSQDEKKARLPVIIPLNRTLIIIMSLLFHLVSIVKCTAWYCALMPNKMATDWLIWSEPAVDVMLVQTNEREFPLMIKVNKLFPYFVV